MPLRIFIVLLLSFGSSAFADCPVGKWVKSSDTDLSFAWRLGSVGSPINKKCHILNPEVFAAKGAVVKGCIPGERGETYIVEPLGRTYNDCYSMEQVRVSLPAEKFVVQAEPPPVAQTIDPSKSRKIAKDQPAVKAESAEETETPALDPMETGSINRKATATERLAYAKESFQRGDPVSALLDDIKVEKTGIKSSSEIDRYTNCMLSQQGDESKARKAYQESYRAMIAFANRTFGVPIGLLSCTCGRESRYASKTKGVAKEDKSTAELLVERSKASGVCQATGSFVEEINKWVSKPGRMRNEWNEYIESLGSRLEDPSCRNLPLTKAMIEKCPSLGLGTSAIYMRHIFARFEGKKDEMSEEDWGRQSVESFAVASGAYNVGVSFADNVLDGITNRKTWPQHLLKNTCESWLVSSDDPAKRKKQVARAQHKFAEVKNHLVAIRNCLQKDNFLDHQGKPMDGACGGTDAQKQKQLAGLEKFKGSLPVRCESGRISNTPATSNDGTE